jgi:hypothetical protein
MHILLYLEWELGLLPYLYAVLAASPGGYNPLAECYALSLFDYFACRTFTRCRIIMPGC